MEKFLIYIITLALAPVAMYLLAGVLVILNVSFETLLGNMGWISFLLAIYVVVMPNIVAKYIMPKLKDLYDKIK